MTLVQPYGMLQGERLLHLCIGASIVFHAILLISAPRLPEAPPPPVRFSATLRQAVAPHPSEPTAPAPVQETSPLKPVKPSPVARPTPAPPPLPQPAADSALAKTSAPAPTPALAAPSMPPAPAAVADARPPTPAPAAPAVEVREPAKAAAPAAPSSNDPSEAELVNSYQSQLAQVAAKYKRYPNEAMQNNWEGVATVRMRIGVDGKTAAVEVVNSSGHRILDEQASLTINKAKPFVQIPAGLRGKEFLASVRVVFSLKN